MSSATAFNIIKRNNIPTKTKGGIYELPIDEIVVLYKSGMKVTDIAEKYNVCYKTIYNYLKSNNIKPDYIYTNQSLDRNYFKFIDRYDKAYFLGFLITDGSVVGNNITLQIKAEDSRILNTLSKKICNENPIYYDNRGLASLHFKSKELVNDLAQYGVVERKTFSTYLPIFYDINLMSHLIRGMIDGDGWISYKGHNIGFCAAHESIVTAVRDFLVYTLGVYNVKVIKSNTVYSIQWCSKKDIYLIGDFIYHDRRDCYLDRKFYEFVQIVTHDNIEITN